MFCAHFLSSFQCSIVCGTSCRMDFKDSSVRAISIGRKYLKVNKYIYSSTFPTTGYIILISLITVIYYCNQTVYMIYGVLGPFTLSEVYNYHCGFCCMREVSFLLFFYRHSIYYQRTVNNQLMFQLCKGSSIMLRINFSAWAGPPSQRKKVWQGLSPGDIHSITSRWKGSSLFLNNLLQNAFLT